MQCLPVCNYPCVEDLAWWCLLATSKCQDSALGISYRPILQGVAVNWIFSSRIKFVGLEVILGVMTVVGGSGLCSTFWRSLGGPPGEQDVLKNTFLIKIVGKNSKNVSHCQTTPYPIDWNEKNRLSALEKCLKPLILTHFCFTELGILERRVPLN